MTISYNRLGSNGRLGNQMFQYASLRGIANYNQYQWMIPPPDCNHRDNYGLFDTFEMTHCKPENLGFNDAMTCLLYTSPSPRDTLLSRMPSSA